MIVTDEILPIRTFGERVDIEDTWWDSFYSLVGDFVDAAIRAHGDSFTIRNRRRLQNTMRQRASLISYSMATFRAMPRMTTGRRSWIATRRDLERQNAWLASKHLPEPKSEKIAVLLETSAGLRTFVIGKVGFLVADNRGLDALKIDRRKNAGIGSFGIDLKEIQIGHPVSIEDFRQC